jgi:hypothetical protein
MRFRSSGLGEKELKGRMAKLSPVGKDLLVYQIHTYEPVEWQMMAALEYKDIRAIVKGLLKPNILLHVVRTLFYLRENPKEPEEILILKL